MSRNLAMSLLTIALATASNAQEPPLAERDQPARPDNHYAAGDRVEIKAPQSGDVVVAGRRVEILQPVGGDVLAAGWRVTMSARAEDDVRIAAGDVSVNAPVSGDLTVAGGDVTVGPEARVSGRSWVTGNIVRVNGVFERELRIAGATVEIGGEMRKPLHVICDRLEVLPSARILAPLTYESPREARIADAAVVNGPIKYERIEEREARQARAFPGGSTILFSVHLFLAGLLIVMFFPRVETTIVAALRDHPGKSVAAGVVLFVTLPIAAILLIVSIVGLPIGLVLAALYALALFASVLTTAFVVGDVEAKLVKAGPVVSRGQHALMLLAGVVTLALLKSFLGPVIVVASILFGLGALVLAAFDEYSRTVPVAS